MIHRINDRLNGMNAIARHVSRKYPEERILSALSATLLETKDFSPVGWSWKRLFQKRGIIVFTDNRIFFQGSFWSLFTFTYMLGVAATLLAFSTTKDFAYLVSAVVFLALVIQRLPVQRDIPFSDITAARLGSVRGTAGYGHLVTIVHGANTVQIAALDLPDQVQEMLSAVESTTA